MIYGILLAAGSGTRFGSKKQYLTLAGVPVWRRSLEMLFSSGVEEVWLVAPSTDISYLTQEVSPDSRVSVVAGGATRSESVQAGLAALLNKRHDVSPQDLVAIHDAARPFTDASDVKRVIEMAFRHGGAILGRLCTDTVKRVINHDGANHEIVETIPREELMLAETPQVFWWQWLQEHYLAAAPDTLARATDDASIMESGGKPVKVVASSRPNLKITRQDDMEYADWLAKRLWGGE